MSRPTSHHSNDSVNRSSDEEEMPSKVPLLETRKVRVYPQRWLALGIFASHELTNNMMWIMFSPITTVASCYYGVSLFWVNSLSWIFMLSYVLFLLPATWFLERFGLRATAIVGVCLNTLGAWLRFAGSGEEGLFLLVTGYYGVL